MNEELEDALSDTDIFERDLSKMRETMWFLMKVWWVFMPFTLFAPAWNAVSKSPLEQGTWIGFAVVAAICTPFWITFGVMGKRLREALDYGDEQRVEIERAKAAKRKILQVRAERIERAERRLERIQQAEMEAERQTIVDDLERMRREFGNDGSA